MTFCFPRHRKQTPHQRYSSTYFSAVECMYYLVYTSTPYQVNIYIYIYVYHSMVMNHNEPELHRNLFVE